MARPWRSAADKTNNNAARSTLDFALDFRPASQISALKVARKRAKRFASAVKKKGLASFARRIPLEALEEIHEQLCRWALGQSYEPSKALPSIRALGDFSALPESTLLQRSIERITSDAARPLDFVHQITGMSGRKYRSLINSFIESHPDPRYLEIGSWQGSTAAAALYGNAVKAVCIDNWSQYGGPKSAFLANMDYVLSRSPAAELRLVEDDFRRVDYTSLGRFNIFMFDGPHDERDQYDGIMVARPALEKSFVLIVDDWNWRHVRLGTFRAIRDAGYSISCSVEIRTTQNNTHPAVHGSSSDWHNGYFIADLIAA